MFKKKPIDPSQEEIETELIQMIHQYFEEFFTFLKKVEPLLLIITLLIALYTLLSYQMIPESVGNIAERTLLSIAGTIGLVYLGMILYWAFQLLYYKTKHQRNYNFITPLFLGMLGTILVGTSVWISSIHSDSPTSPVVSDLTVFSPIIFSLFVGLYFFIKTIWQTQNYYLLMKFEEPTLKDRIKKYKGAIISGIITSALIITITSILILRYHVILYDTFIYYWPVLLFGGILADLVSKTKNIGDVYINGLLTIFLILTIYFFVVMVGIILIYYGTWEHPVLVQEWYKIFDPVIIVLGMSSISVLGGGYLSYAIRKITKKYHDSELE